MSVLQALTAQEDFVEALGNCMVLVFEALNVVIRGVTKQLLIEWIFYCMSQVVQMAASADTRQFIKQELKSHTAWLAHQNGYENSIYRAI